MTAALMTLFLIGCLRWAVPVLFAVARDEAQWWRSRRHPGRSWEPRVPEQRETAA